MNSRALAAAVSAAILVSGCAAKKEEPPAEPAKPVVDVAAEEQAIRTRSGEWMNYMNSHDAASLGGIYAPDVISIYDGNVTKGASNIQAGISEELTANPKAVFTWTSDAVHVAASGDLAYETGSINVDLDGAEGKADATNGSFVTVWQKVDGAWRVVADAGTENAKKPKDAAAPAN
jgi:uncharacterized protein (TIGR02246 family)